MVKQVPIQLLSNFQIRNLLIELILQEQGGFLAHHVKVKLEEEEEVGHSTDEENYNSDDDMREDQQYRVKLQILEVYYLWSTGPQG